jgi:hypothetical protein
MDIEEPMDVDAAGDFDKFDDLLEEGEYRESNHISRKILPSVVNVCIYKHCFYPSPTNLAFL